MAHGYVDLDDMELYLERYESGDPIKDYYDESEIQEMLADAYKEMLEHRNY